MMAEVEFGGMTFKGGKMMVILTALSTLGGASWGAFEFYKDYMDMKEIIANIDTTEIERSVDEAIDYSRSIKNDLRDDFNRMEANVDRVEDQNRELEDKVKDMIDKADERFDNKRESLQTDTEIKINALEDRLNMKIQAVLDNPLASFDFDKLEPTASGGSGR
jgi:Skp family chaperone for outer membrane proteins